MREGLSQTVNIACMPSVTGNMWSGYYETIICKWQINGVDHYDTQTQAINDCFKIGNSSGLWSTGFIPNYRTTPTNDQAMLTKYVDFSTI